MFNRGLEPGGSVGLWHGGYLNQCGYVRCTHESTAKYCLCNTNELTLRKYPLFIYHREAKAIDDDTFVERALRSFAKPETSFTPLKKPSKASGLKTKSLVWARCFIVAAIIPCKNVQSLASKASSQQLMRYFSETDSQSLSNRRP